MKKPNLTIQQEFLGFRFGPRFEFYDSPPRQRMIFIGHQIKKISVPRLCFLKIKYYGKFVDFLIFRVLDDKKLNANTPLMIFLGSNFHGASEDDYLRSLPRICFGDVASKVWKGQIDPIEAFWNTSFAYDGFNLRNIREYRKKQTPEWLYRHRFF